LAVPAQIQSVAVVPGFVQRLDHVRIPAHVLGIAVDQDDPGSRSRGWVVPSGQR
jgi:hypothetical protein